MDITLIVLTASSKHKNLCVAGIDVTTGDFIRLVSDDGGINYAIPCGSTRYLDGTYCSPLDVIKVSIIEHRPLEFQPENILVDLNKRWEKVGQASLQDVISIHPFDNHKFIFGNASYAVNETIAKSLGHSLTLVQVENFELFTAQNVQGQMRSKCRFKYQNNQYDDMSVTDPMLYGYPKGFKSDEAILVISIPNDGPWLYKFVSKAFLPQP